ncbi:hypothetical protein [Pseudomonas asiatica]|uniref:hypothetical protein n=1 Tax=Pseudomonas asiatica TaxID=2219225 RepID=UPI0010C13BEB|nr:hypothetical protein [Pseudomonas asiatica]EKT4528345.1 hypothetical protein [Pseudomonas putida]
MTTVDNALLLNLEWDFPQVGRTTLRGYLCALLAQLWKEQDNFIFRRAFGFAHWQRDLLPPLIEAGAIEKIPDDFQGDLVAALHEQNAKLEALIATLIPMMASPAK